MHMVLIVHPDWVDTARIHGPLVSDQGTWSRDPHRRLIREAISVHRDPIFADLFGKIATAAAPFRSGSPRPSSPHAGMPGAPARQYRHARLVQPPRGDARCVLTRA